MPTRNSKSESIIAESEAMQEVLDLVEQIAPTEVPIFITGETGVGKEVVAQAIHEKSRRKNQPFEAINCGAFSGELLLSELFGHEEGSFTGAIRRRRGMLERANGGTLFLDEVGEMSGETQVTLLRALEEHEFTRVGGEAVIKVDVRIVSATNTELDKIREDLYERIATIPIHILPLRERREDIPPLAESFLSEFREKYNKPINNMAPAVLSQLQDADWPRNVRQLRNAVERAVVLADTDELRSSDFLDAPGDPKHFANLGVTRGGRRREYERWIPSQMHSGTETFEVNIDEAKQLYNFIWNSKSTLDTIAAHIFQMVYKKHLDANNGNERNAKQATQETLGNISDYIFNRHKSSPINIEDTET